MASLLWICFALLGAFAYAMLALKRGETVNSAYLVIAAICTHVIGYRFYSKWIAARVLTLNDRRATPCEAHDDGKDFVRTHKWIVFGHHFAAISGPGPLVGPVLAAQFGYLPSALWILIGVVLGGAVQDFVILFCSLRRNGKSLGQMVREELNSTAGLIASAAILAILTILLAVLALVVVQALAESPWGVFTVAATIPIALLMGGYMRFVRIGRVLEASAMGVGLLLLAVWGGKLVHENASWAQVFSITDIHLAWSIILYGAAASILPVWMLLAPRDYLSTFMKLGTIFALAAGILLVLPELKMPALTSFADGSGMVVAGGLFPFCFITIACGAISGFHTLIASGTTPKIITRESYARTIGYGAMCLESLVAIMALVAACTLEPGIYLSMNIKGEPDAIVAKIAGLNQPAFQATRQEMDALAAQVGEKSLYSRTGGAATLAVGMAKIFTRLTEGKWLDLWYHFAIMFEALFILTTIDAGTRVGRYILQDFLGHLWKPLGDTRDFRSNLLASVLLVGAWGWFLIQGVRDPLGGINSLWPLFGIANQMLAAIALCLGTTILLKMNLPGGARDMESAARSGRPAMALITLIPLGWLLAVTFTAGIEKIFHPDPRIGFLAQADRLKANQPRLEKALLNACAEKLEAYRELGACKLKGGNAPGEIAELEKRHLAKEQLVKTAENASARGRTQRFNNLLDAAVAGIFLILVSVIILISLREWLLLLTRRKRAVLHESTPVWLPDYALKESGPNLRSAAGAAAIALGLARELSGETQFERAKQHTCVVGSHQDQQAYVQVTEDKFNGVRRCC